MGGRRFLRLVEGSKGRIELQASTVRITLRASRTARQIDRDRSEERGVQVDLVSLVHVGERDYYRSVQKVQDAADVVLAECITAQSNLCGLSLGSGQLRKLRCPLKATNEQVLLARAHELSAQLDCLSLFSQNKDIYIADLSLEELDGVTSMQKGVPGMLGRFGEVVATAATGRRGGKRGGGKGRPGEALIRLLMGFTPCPELSLILFDWARADGYGRPSTFLWALLDAMSRFDIAGMRKIAFGLLLIANQAGEDAREETMIKQRNKKAIEALKTVVTAPGPGVDKITMLYGALHMDDLLARVRREFDVIAEEDMIWTRVWGVADVEAGPLKKARLGFLLFPSYFILGGLDYIDTVRSIGAAVQDVPLVVSIFLLYLLRRGLFYYSLARWLIEWDQQFFELNP